MPPAGVALIAKLFDCKDSFMHVIYGDVIMGAIASQITSITIVYWTVYSDADQRKHQSSALLAFVWGIHRGPVNSPHKWPVTRKMFPFDDVIMDFWYNFADQTDEISRYILVFCVPTSSEYITLTMILNEIKTMFRFWKFSTLSVERGVI